MQYYDFFLKSQLRTLPVNQEMLISNKRMISNTLIQHIAERIGVIAQKNRTSWRYSLPNFEQEIHTVGVGLEGY